MMLTKKSHGSRDAAGDQFGAKSEDARGDPGGAQSQGGVVSWAAPAGEKLFEDYTLRVNGQAVPVYSCRVSAMPFNQVWPGYQRPLDQTELAGFAYWGMSGPVEVEVTSKRALQVGSGAAHFAGHPAGRPRPAHHLPAVAAGASDGGVGRPASCLAPVRRSAGGCGSQAGRPERALFRPGRSPAGKDRTEEWPDGLRGGRGGGLHGDRGTRGVGRADSRARHHRHQRIRARATRAAAPFTWRTAPT